MTVYGQCGIIEEVFSYCMIVFFFFQIPVEWCTWWKSASISLLCIGQMPAPGCGSWGEWPEVLPSHISHLGSRNDISLELWGLLSRHWLLWYKVIGSLVVLYYPVTLATSALGTRCMHACTPPGPPTGIHYLSYRPMTLMHLGAKQRVQRTNNLRTLHAMSCNNTRNSFLIRCMRK